MGPDASLRIAARPRARFNIVPVEYVAAGIVALAEHPGSKNGVFHLIADAPTQDAMLETITARLDVEGVRLVDSDAQRLPGASGLERRVARMPNPADWTVKDVPETRQLLQSLGGLS